MGSARAWRLWAVARSSPNDERRVVRSFPRKRRGAPGLKVRPFALDTVGRLTQRAQFLNVAAQGRKAATHGVVLQLFERGDGLPARLGFTVTKKVGNAVIRNHTRRRLREAARLLLRDEPVMGKDIVLIGRDATRKREFTLLIDDLRRAMRKAVA